MLNDYPNIKRHLTEKAKDSKYNIPIGAGTVAFFMSGVGAALFTSTVVAGGMYAFRKCAKK